MEKTKTVQIRTSGKAKEMTVKTLNDNGLTISTAYERLMSGRGLISRSDAELIADCVQLHKDLRHLAPGDSVRRNKQLYAVCRNEVAAAKKRARMALENLISALEDGSAPKYANVKDDGGVLDAFYTVRVPFSGMASKEGSGHSENVRHLLDWIQDIPARSNAGHMMSVVQLADTVRDSISVLAMGKVAIKGKEVAVTPEVLRATAASIEGATTVLESVSKF